MKVKISEVWNSKGQSKELAIIEVETRDERAFTLEVLNWISANRPDLSCAGPIDHGFEAHAIN